MSGDFNRRKFIKFGLGTIGGISLFGIYTMLGDFNEKKLVEKEKDPDKAYHDSNDKPEEINENLEDKDQEEKEEKENEVNGLPYRALGKTGEKVSLFALGTGAGAVPLEYEATREDAYELIEKSIDSGINYIDTAPTYADGISEENVGEVMKLKRDKVLLATKTRSWDYDGVLRDVQDSLERLDTDYIDLYQFHGLSNYNDVDAIFDKGGGVEALEELKDEGVIKYTGVTGHNRPEVLMAAIDKHGFDCLLMPLNPADVHSRPFQKRLLDKAKEKDMGIIAMKVAAYGRLIREDGISSMWDALNYVYSFPISTAVVGVSTLEELRENIEITKNYEKLSKEKLKELEDLTVHYQYEANFFKHEW